MWVKIHGPITAIARIVSIPGEYARPRLAYSPFRYDAVEMALGDRRESGSHCPGPFGAAGAAAGR